MNLRMELHSHTEYSNLRLVDSINKPELLIDRAIELGLKGIAITDHECLSGHVRVQKYQDKIKEENPDFKIALGNEIYLVDERTKGQRYYHFILIAKDAIGHKQLRELSSLAWLNEYNDRGERVPTLKSELKEIIGRNPGHVIATTACIGGELSNNLLKFKAAEQTGNETGRQEAYAAAVNFIQDMQSIFGKDFYIEFAPGCSNEQIIANKGLIAIADLFKIKYVIGCDAHYLKKEDRYVHKAYLNSKDGEREVDAFYEYSYLQSEEEILEHLSKSFDNYKEIYDNACHNSMEIWDKIENYSLFHKQTIPKVEVKDYPKLDLLHSGEDERVIAENHPILTSMFNSDNKIERYWANECLTNLCNKKEWTTYDLANEGMDYLDRLEYEADIKKTIGEKLETNMFAYPVTLQHYVDLFWECGSMVGAGRGSSCSGLNHYLLGITQLDPLKWELPFWRYLNKERTELGDIDLDLCPSKRPRILNEIKKERGKKFLSSIPPIVKANCGCTLIATFGTETTKSAIQTACRGYRSEECPDGIDIDTSQYLSSLVPQERGFLWSLKDVVYGNTEKGRKAVSTFVNEVETYPGLMDIMFAIEGLIKQRGSHASGVILFDEDPFEFGCFMRTPSGDVITQYDLHDAESAGMTKYDFLVTSVQDKLVEAIKLLQQYGEIDKNKTLREIYNEMFQPENLPLDDKKCWDALQAGTVLDTFQFDSVVGSQAAKKIHPTSILEMADANGLMRLMTSEQGAETPMDKYIRFKNNINLWYEEMRRYGLTEDEMKTLEPHFLKSYGVPPSQEQLMTMLMDKDICGFSLAEANAARKIVGKKQMSKIPALREKVLQQAKSKALGIYVWDCGIGPQMGYSFSVIHAIAYSFIGYQTLYIGTHWNPIFWDTACLRVNSGSLEEEHEEEIVDIYEPEDFETYDYIDLPGHQEKKKIKKSTNYGKIATAIGDITTKGIKVSLVDINKSDFTFMPDIENNQILFGLKGISNIGDDVIDKIKSGRPYSSLKDFMLRCKLTKTAMINLIKAGAFDEIEKNGLGNRKMIMGYYLYNECGLKKRITLQNFNGLIEAGLVPKELELEIRVFNFNKFLKNFKVGRYYTFNNEAISFFDKFYSDCSDKLQIINGVVCILQTDWDKIYKKQMDNARNWIKDNSESILKAYNQKIFKDAWDKYAFGTVSHWEMDALCFYHREHELANIDFNKYGIRDFNELESEPVDYFFKRGQRQIPIYKLSRIAGTVIDKNDSKSMITLLTTSGVVDVKFTREYYAMFKKQISDIGPDGKKHVKEKSWFKRGTMLMITGFRRDDQFVGKTYKNTIGHQLYKITEVKGNEIAITHERWSSNTSEEEDE